MRFWLPSLIFAEIENVCITKILRDEVILSNVWTLWVLETLDIVPVKKGEFS